MTSTIHHHPHHQPSPSSLLYNSASAVIPLTLLATAAAMAPWYLFSSSLSVAEAAKAPFQYSSLAERRMLLQDRALLHVNLMNTMGLCRHPRPQIIYPPATPAKVYYPRGTLLHRCADQSGCCPNPGEACRPEAIDTVELVFFVNHFAFGRSLTAAGGQRTRLKNSARNYTTTTEVLTFTNHTACKCVKLAADAIEHDELQSVVSRPLVKLTGEGALSSTATVPPAWFYHLVGGLAALTLLLVIVLLWRWMANVNRGGGNGGHRGWLRRGGADG